MTKMWTIHWFDFVANLLYQCKSVLLVWDEMLKRIWMVGGFLNGGLYLVRDGDC
jgi:hypothetical protein